MEAIEIECISCGREFEFTTDEQRIYNQKQFDLPKRCPDCRRNKLKAKAKQNHKHERRKTFDWSEMIS